MASGFCFPNSKILTTPIGDLIWYFCGFVLLYLNLCSFWNQAVQLVFPSRLPVVPTPIFLLSR